jgi:anthranilate phosphoribosyltransferase
MMQPASVDLAGDDVRAFAGQIIGGTADRESTTRFLVDLARRGESSSDIFQMAKAFQAAAVTMDSPFPIVADLCGTGGGTVRTFNVSTVASFVVAASGVPVAKHGNRSNAGSCGSADLMEALNVNIQMEPRQAAQALAACGITFLFAPIYHPAMRNAVPARKAIPHSTVFNILGPLLNPASARKRQLIGVHSPRLLEIVPPILLDLGIERALVVHGHPGMDEVSTLGATEVVEVTRGSTERYSLDPGELGIESPTPAEIAARPPTDSAVLARRILSGEETAGARVLTIINGACALLAYGEVRDVAQGMRAAEKAIDSGRALDRLERLIAASRESAPEGKAVVP